MKIAMLIAWIIFVLGCLSVIFGIIFALSDRLFESEVWALFFYGGFAVMAFGLLAICSLTVIPWLLWTVCWFRVFCKIFPIFGLTATAWWGGERMGYKADEIKSSICVLSGLLGYSKRLGLISDINKCPDKNGLCYTREYRTLYENALKTAIAILDEKLNEHWLFLEPYKYIQWITFFFSNLNGGETCFCQ